MILAQRLTNALDSFPLLAIPLFILAAEIMNVSGATERIFRLANVAIGHVAGGLAHVNVVASILFSGMSGSAVADASGLGAIEVKAMLKQGYTRTFAAAVTAASSTIGPIIPPSVPMVIYGVISGTAIGELFLAGFVPGLLMGVAMMALHRADREAARLSQGRAVRGLCGRSAPPSSPRSRRCCCRSSSSAASGAALFSPTEAAGGGGGLCADPRPGDPPLDARCARCRASLPAPPRHTASIMLIVAAAALYGWLVSTAQIPQAVRGAMLGLSEDPSVVLFLIVAILLVMGMFMELIAILTIAVPVFLPVARAAGIDQVHFGVVAVLTLMIGLLTPPFGLNIFILQRISRASYGAIVRETLPFIAILILLLGADHPLSADFALSW